jgi:hypothetical protein
MPVGRNIFFSENCNAAAEAVGGYQRIDVSLIPILDALERNPYGFPKVESDWFSARYIVTKPFEGSPALIWLFFVEANGDVVIDHVEIYEGY